MSLSFPHQPIARKINLNRQPRPIVQRWLYTPNGRRDLVTGVFRILYDMHESPLRGIPEVDARDFLSRHFELFGMSSVLSDLSTSLVQESPAGSHVRFTQVHSGVPIYRADIVVSVNKQNVITFVSNNYKPGITLSSVTPSLNQDQAIQSAYSSASINKSSVINETAALMIYAEDSSPRLAYRVVISSSDPIGTWEIFVDANSAEVFHVEDIAVYEHDRSPSAVNAVNGTGYVFNPDPLTTAQAFYGSPGFTDNNDQDSPQLTAQRVLVSLKNISFDGFTYRLSGPFVNIRDWDLPAIAPATAVNPDSFRFTRSQTGFEDVNAYYQLDSSQRYIQSLGFVNIQNRSIDVDSHGFNGEDNARFDPQLNALAFGQGNVDDAEDADVLWHEYGHAIQFGTVPGWGGGEEASLGEGFGDYWAGSYSRMLNPTFSRNFAFTWDAGFNGAGGSIWAGRPLNDSRIYPDNGVLSISDPHDAGQIWSSVLLSLWDDLGRDVMDKLVLLSHYYMGTSGTMRDNAAAIVQADQDLFGGAHLTALVTRFMQRNFLGRPSISHTPLRDTETLTGFYSISSTITAGFFPIDINTVKVVWGRDSIFTDTLSLQRGMAPDEFVGQIPANGVPANYRYYIIARDTFGSFVSSPVNAPAQFYSFHAGTDTIPPVVKFVQLHNQALFSWPPVFRLQTTDNIGIDSVQVEYVRQRGSLTGSFFLPKTVDSTYQANFPLDTSQVMIGDSILYRIRISDLAAIRNVVTIPSTDYHRFMVSRANIIIINHDLASSPVTSPQLFFSALGSKGFSIDTVNFGSFATTSLPDYDLTIMSAGVNTIPFSNPTKRHAVVDYVNQGGKILVEGGQVGFFYRKSGPFDAETDFRRQVLRDSIWVSDVTTSDITFTQSSHPIFTLPNNLTSPIVMTTRTISADRDAMTIELGVPGITTLGSWSGSAGTASIIAYTAPSASFPTSIFLPFAISSITDTLIAKRFVENVVSSFFPRSGTVSDVHTEMNLIPTHFALYQNYPNPFNPSTMIRYQLPTESKVSIRIYNVLGQVVKSLVDEVQNAGYKSLEWNATNAASGIYYYKLEASGVNGLGNTFMQVRKMVLMK